MVICSPESVPVVAPEYEPEAAFKAVFEVVFEVVRATASVAALGATYMLSVGNARWL